MNTSGSTDTPARTSKFIGQQDPFGPSLSGTTLKPSLTPKNEGIVNKLRRLGCDVEISDQTGAIRVEGHFAKINEEDVAALAELRNLGSLDLRGCQITNGAFFGLAKNKKLVHLNLSQTAITDEGLKAIANLPFLRTLDLSDTQITDAGVVALTMSRPRSGS